MKFKRFSSIENSYRQKEIQSIQINFPGEKFVVQEKVHGANFSFWTDGKDVKCAKRRKFIKEDEKFHNYEKILEKLRSRVLLTFQLEKNQNKDLEELVIFGEIFGGSYPHDDVDKRPVSRVQKGVFYHPDIKFLAFDIRTNGSYMHFYRFKLLCDLAGIPYLPALKEGTLEECLAFSDEYQTTIPEMYGLPEIENNTCEGNIIRPINTLIFGNGSRAILKSKNNKFTEKDQTRKNFTPPDPAPEHVVEIQNKAVQYITENRLRNVLSKVGTVSNKEFGKLLGLFSKDALEDLAKDAPEYLELETKERKMVTSLVNRESGNLIRPNFLNIIDGNF